MDGNCHLVQTLDCTLRPLKIRVSAVQFRLRAPVKSNENPIETVLAVPLEIRLSLGLAGFVFAVWIFGSGFGAFHIGIVFCGNHNPGAGADVRRHHHPQAV